MIEVIPEITSLPEIFVVQKGETAKLPCKATVSQYNKVLLYALKMILKMPIFEKETEITTHN